MGQASEPDQEDGWIDKYRAALDTAANGSLQPRKFEGVVEKLRKAANALLQIRIGRGSTAAARHLPAPASLKQEPVRIDKHQNGRVSDKTQELKAG